MQTKKMQRVSFKSVNEFLEFLPAEELKIVENLRKIVFNCIPDVTEKLAYNVPFYKRYRNICFIWPSSVLWGNKKTYDGVRFGFTNGYLLPDENGYLHRGDRKQVNWKDLSQLKEADLGILKSYLFEAVIIDEKFRKKKNH